MQTLKMDFQSQSTPPVVPVMQSDAQSRFIGITLYNGGIPYEAPEGASYTVQYRGPGANNMGWYDTIQLSSGTRKAVIVDSASKNVVTLELAEQALRVNGNVFVNLCVVTNAGYMLKTFPILCRVTGAAFPDTVAMQSFFYVTGITSEQWLAYVTACQDAQKRAEDAAAKFVTDPTLSLSGKAADAAKVGEAVNAEAARAKAAEEENAKGIGQLKEDKVDCVQNLAAVSKLKNENAINANITTNDDGSITVVPTEHYGRYDFSYLVPNDGKEKTFYLSANITIENTSQTANFAKYCYNGSTDLGQMMELAVQTKLNGTNRNISQILRYKDMQYNTDKIVIGVITNVGIEYTITKKSMLFIDVTKLAESVTDSVKLLDKCEVLYGADYWEKRVVAETAETAETAKTAETVLSNLVNRGSDAFEIIGENECVFAPRKKYYGFSIKPQNDYSLSNNGSILIVMETDFASPNGGTFIFGQANADNNGYASTTDSTYYGKIDGKHYYYAVCPYEKNKKKSYDIFHSIDKDYVGVSHTAKIMAFGYIDSAEVSQKAIDIIVRGKTLLDLFNDVDSIDKKLSVFTQNRWNGKNVLVIGDSITAAQKWQKKLNEMLGMNVTTHAKGGVGTISMVDGDKGLGGDYDNETSASGVLKPLSVDDVKDKSLIVVLPAYNDRGKEDGRIGDCYKTDGSGQLTIAGIIQYTINRIYDTLTRANNLTCKVLYATPHCPGRYPYIDADGYEEYPVGSGRTMETLANTIVAVGNHNNIPVCDLWHSSGSNKYTWNVFGASSNPVNEQYSPYELDSTGTPVNTTRIRYQKGKAYYQKRDGQVVLETYTGSAPFPYNGDQLHCSPNGYARLGECIVGAIISHYGN